MFNRGERDLHELEIASHYVERLKYGMAGSNGSCCSNYIHHTLNNNEIVSICCADKRNPYDKKRRLVVLFSKISLSLLLAVIFATKLHDKVEVPYVHYVLYTRRLIPSYIFDYSFETIVIAIIIGPYGILLDSIASCYVCTRWNTCVWVSSGCGFVILMLYGVLSAIFIITAVTITMYALDSNTFLLSFLLSNLFDQLSYFYFRIWNWLLVSWRGILCCPRFPTTCHTPGDEECPGEWCPILHIPPLSFLLSMYGMGQKTYVEDRADFFEKFPGRICVECVFMERYKFLQYFFVDVLSWQLINCLITTTIPKKNGVQASKIRPERMRQW